MATLEHTELLAAWSDRFRTPSLVDLVAPLPRPARTAVLHATQTLVKGRGLRERLRWHGVWRWSCAYEANAGADRAVAYLIPDPNRPRMCIPVTRDAANMLPARKTPSYVRQELASCPAVDGVLWPIWTVESKQMISELFATILPE